MLDLDGVCCNFVSPVLDVFGKKDITWPDGETSIEKVLNVSTEEMWEKVDNKGSDFWRNLKHYFYFYDLLSELKKIGDVVFLSSPSWDSGCVKGKLEWLQDRFGKSFKDYIFTSKKHYCANNRTILIDDFSKNCKKFIEFGGQAILFPQPWNDNYMFKTDNDKIQYVLGRVDMIMTNIIRDGK